VAQNEQRSAPVQSFIDNLFSSVFGGGKSSTSSSDRGSSRGSSAGSRPSSVFEYPNRDSHRD
jgi:hypothetical protein